MITITIITIETDRMKGIVSSSELSSSSINDRDECVEDSAQKQEENTSSDQLDHPQKRPRSPSLQEKEEGEEELDLVFHKPKLHRP